MRSSISICIIKNRILLQRLILNLFFLLEIIYL
jgi:hypothetical protein